MKLNKVDNTSKNNWIYNKCPPEIGTFKIYNGGNSTMAGFFGENSEMGFFQK